MLPEEPHASITVAIATVNRPAGLERCVTALLEGRMLPAEIVIVDQSPDDRTARLVDESAWSERVPVRYVRQACTGLAASRNAGVAHSSSPIVAFTDDDCVPDREWLSAIAAAFDDARRPDAVTGRVLPLGPVRTGTYPVSTRTSKVRRFYRGPAIPWSVGTGGNAAVRREWLERVDGFDERLGTGSAGLAAEDMDLFHRLLRGGAAVLYAPDAIVLHEQQTADGRRTRAVRYAFGMGAFCAIAVSRADVYALWIVARWLMDRCDTMLRACVRRQSWLLHEELLMLAAGARGGVYGFRVARARPRRVMFRRTVLLPAEAATGIMAQRRPAE